MDISDNASPKIPKVMVVMDNTDLCSHGNVETVTCSDHPVENIGSVILPLRYRKHIKRSPHNDDVTPNGGCNRESPSNDVTANGRCHREFPRNYVIPNGGWGMESRGTSNGGCTESRGTDVTANVGCQMESLDNDAAVKKCCSKCTYANDTAKLNHGEYPDNDGIDESSEGSREKDLTVALAWLRQEIGKLKEQDKVLTRQFLELRAVIRSLQESGSGTNSFGSGSDVTNVSGSAQSLNEDGRHDGSRRGSRNNSLLRGEDYLGEFRGRTVSLLLPKSAMSLSVDKYISRECF